MIHVARFTSRVGGRSAEVAKLTHLGGTHAGGTSAKGKGTAMAAAPRVEEDPLEALIATMSPSQKQLFSSKLKKKAAPVMHDKPPKLATAAPLLQVLRPDRAPQQRH